MRKGVRYEVCYCVAGKVRGVCIAIVCVFLMCLINYITLCGRGGVSEEEFPFNCYDCNGQ